MKLKCCENLGCVLLIFFLELIKRCCTLLSSIEMVDPHVIKINPEKPENISFIIILNDIIGNRTGKRAIFKSINNSIKDKSIYSIDEDHQDQVDKKKIEFIIDEKDFKDYYGKFHLSYNDVIDYNNTILIYTNDIILKNPKKKYFLVGKEMPIVKYDFSLPIIFDEINKIEYYEEPNSNSKKNLTNYSIEDNKLVFNFDKSNEPKSFVFSIYPEYDPNSTNKEIHRFYLYFHDYLLKNDAIYINKSNDINEVSFNLTLRENYNINNLEISGFLYNSKNIGKNDYEITINFGRKNEPGKISITYNGQERELFYILYESNFRKCYEKKEIESLEITMDWIEEMEYEHNLYFIDITNKKLTQTYNGKIASTISYKYKISTLVLNSGSFTLKSTISSLNYTDYNPVDDKHLFFYINPNSEAFDTNYVLIYSHNNSKQYLNITSSTDPKGIEVLKEIILKKDNNNEDKILISNTNQTCKNINNTLSCDLKDIIFNFEENKIGNYSIMYKSICDNELLIDKKIVEIKKGIGLSDISPRWINKSKIIESNLTLTYDDDLSKRRLLNICFIEEKQKEDKKTFICPKKFTIIESRKVNVTLNNMEEGKYYVFSNFSDIDFIQEDINFKVSEPLKFNFNHHYFVNNGKSKLIITVNNTKNEIDTKFKCIIVETIENTTLNKISDNCSIFDYPINKEGTIKFNYYDEDDFIIPINDSIIVVSDYSKFFSFNEKFCYYHQFDISIDILSSYINKLNIRVFLKNGTFNISLNNNEYNGNKYTYKKMNSSFFDKEFDLYISEEIEDDEIYLYKSNQKVKFTDIKTPEYIIEPYITIVFSDVNCNLNSSTFLIKKTDTPSIYNYLNYWKYNNSQLYFNITGKFYQPNRFKYYFYQIDYKNITNISNEEELYQTFVSKRLNDTNFDIIKVDKNDYVNITNKEKDFYFPLLSILNTKLEHRVPKTVNETLNESNTDKEQSTIIYKYNLSINDALTLNYLKREVKEWEKGQNLENSIYYFFNKDNIINGSSLAIKPTLFAFNIPRQEDYKITILYSHEKQKNYYKANLTNCTDNINNILEQECFINISEIIGNKKERILINITDGIANFTKYIDFVYYHLDKDSKKCQTMDNNMNNITLLVEIPNPDLKERIKLISDYTDIIGDKRDNDTISFFLNGSNINLQSTLLNLYTDDEELNHLFSLQDLGIDILPKYKMRFNNNQTEVKLLPEDNQVVKVKVENNEIINLSDISKFKIIGENNKNLVYDVGMNLVNGEPDALNLIFNLSSVNKTEKNYLLYYFDRCGNDTKKFSTDLKISIATFTLKRKYFVLNNNKNSEYQTLTIEGPDNDKISISVYKNGEYNGVVKKNESASIYNLNFTQSSIGDYTFKVLNDRIESPINGTVYVRENLEDILSLKNNISNCMFSNENKSAIKNFSYKISPSGINTDFRDFQSYFSHDQKDFKNLSSHPDDKDKTFSINYSNEMKNNINLNKTLYIYLTENDDLEQPIYIFSYKYTNIKLHKNFTKFIYTDAEYILFEMNCKINNMENFVLSSTLSGPTYPFSCNDKGTIDNFNQVNGIFRCYLSYNNNDENSLLNFRKTNYNYKDFNIKYSQVQITNEPFFLSQDIYTAKFNFGIPDEIGRNVTININVTIPNNIFYFPDIEKVNYENNSVLNTKNKTDFKDNSQNSISFDLYIINNFVYTITKICRKHCSYCIEKDGFGSQNIDCQFLNETIRTTTPEVFFYFDKHYIALENSSNKNGEKDTNYILKIEATGDSKNEIQNIFYYHYKTPTNLDESKTIKNQSNIYELNMTKGKYTFKYRHNNKNYTIKDVVLVTDYDYEMFDYSDFSGKCIFYNSDTTNEKGLLVSINANPNYDFKNDIILAYLLLELKVKNEINEIELPYNGEKGYKITDYTPFSNNIFEKIYFRESNLRDKNFVFTTFYNISTYTIEKYNLSQQYYKDNIIFYKQNCKSNNIYIKSTKNPDEIPSLLQCEYSDSNNIQYCYTNYEFLFKTNDYFYLYIGKNNLDTSLSINIYNSINASEFIAYYIIPNLYIESSNFEMRNISIFSIDNKNITNYNYNSKSNNLIYKLENNTESWVTELWRKDHPLDRTDTIKNKKVNLKIESKICPNYTVLVLADGANYCMLCREKALGFGENGQKIWFQKDRCVDKCTGNYSIFDDDQKICEICDKKTKIGDNYYCGCLEGTVNHPIDSRCYLPEDPKIKESLLTRPNTQCYRIDGTTLNYCMENTTSTCEVISQSGADFPICHCKDDYTGKYCEIKKDEINLNNNIDVILSFNINNKINEKEPYVISKIRGIVYFIEKDYFYTNSLKIENINLFLNASINSINEAINDKDYNCTQIYDVIELTIHFLLFKIRNSKKLRLLEEEEEENRNNLKFILENAHYLNYLANRHISSPYNFQTDKLNLTSFISYKANAIESSFKTYIKNKTYTSNIIGYSNLNNNNNNDIVILTLFNRKLFYLDSQDDGLIVNLSITNNSVSKNLRNFENFYVYIYSPYININFELAKYYQKRNINIYDKNDTCFTDKCFTSENFEYDLTQKYRKKNVFQKWSLNSESCKYHSFEIESNNIEIICQKFENYGINDSINYATLDLIGKKDYVNETDKVYNLPMRCKKKLNSENYAFWIFLIICFLEIIYIIGITILTLGSLRKVSIRKGLINDGFFYKIPRIQNSNEEMESYNSLPLKKNKDEFNNNVTFDLKSKRSNNKNLFEKILFNFKELYPLSVFCRVSLISPLIMNSWFFVFNTLCLFGFNALIYYEGLIEKRIYDKKRHYFDYPMRKEFHKIILSILLQIAFTVIIKAIILVSHKQYKDLESQLKSCKMKGEEINNDILVRTTQFQDDMIIRRLIGGFLMSIIIIFFFYYTVVFCEVYLNTQRNLVFSWVWSLFWEWVIFAPIYIVVISFLEHKKENSKDPLIYYLKRLFFF